MAALLDYTYFFGIINLDTSKPVTKENIGFYSDFVEEKYLKKLLGQNLYMDYSNNKTAEKWVNFLKAEDFEYAGITYKNNVKQMLAYFLYYHYKSDTLGYDSTVGEMSSNTDNAIRVDDSIKRGRAYNLGIDIYTIAEKYLATNSSLFPDRITEIIDPINSFGI